MAESEKPNEEMFDWASLELQPVIGVDEVGRGCLAGPVYAAASIINTDREFEQYTDSKKLSEKRRDELSDHILENHTVGIGFATIEEIAELNILNAALLAMKRAVTSIQLQGRATVLVDGNKKIPDLDDRYEQITLIKGDLRAHPVAAASIVAKVTRDRLLYEMAEKYPGYGFEKHKGYGTPVHREAIQKMGPCPIHRPTFAGVREYL